MVNFTYRAWYAPLLKKYVVAKNSRQSRTFSTKESIAKYLKNQSKNKKGEVFGLTRLNKNTGSQNPQIVARLRN